MTEKTEKKTIYQKLFEAKKEVQTMDTKKAGRNDYSKYHYFTPEQIGKIVQEVCEKQELLTMFHLKRNELWEYWVLEVVDIATGEKIEFEASTAIPSIKATNVAQQIGGCMTYTERYLKMTAFWIADDSLDFDTTDNTKKTANNSMNNNTKNFSTSQKPRFNDPEFKEFEKKKNSYENWKHALEKIKMHYSISKAMEEKVLSLYKN